MHNVRYDFSSCHIEVPQHLTDEIIEWGKTDVFDEDLYVNHRDPFHAGREDEIHITVLYGIHSELSDKVKPLIVGPEPIKVRLGATDVFSNPVKYDVVMIDVYSEELVKLHEKLQSQIKHTSKYPIYNPHITIAYVKKGKGWKHRGISLWEGKEFTCNCVVFSSKNGTKERITF
jgi:2'-5' RNA ligase